jgi:hypothetical protein
MYTDCIGSHDNTLELAKEDIAKVPKGWICPKELVMKDIAKEEEEEEEDRGRDGA